MLFKLDGFLSESQFSISHVLLQVVSYLIEPCRSVCGKVSFNSNASSLSLQVLHDLFYPVQIQRLDEIFTGFLNFKIKQLQLCYESHFKLDRIQESLIGKTDDSQRLSQKSTLLLHCFNFAFHLVVFSLQKCDFFCLIQVFTM